MIPWKYDILGCSSMAAAAIITMANYALVSNHFTWQTSPLAVLLLNVSRGKTPTSPLVQSTFPRTNGKFSFISDRKHSPHQVCTYKYGKAKLAPPLMPKQAMMAGSGRQFAFCLFVCYDGWRGVVGCNTVRENGAHQRALRTKHFVKLFNPACLQKEAPCFYFVFSGP